MMFSLYGAMKKVPVISQARMLLPYIVGFRTPVAAVIVMYLDPEGRLAWMRNHQTRNTRPETMKP